ncbi:MAG TPA: CdaR family protein [Chloroflexia bacterium]|nr:CdaR family protein [Chloroflexia bacterium]
MDELRAAPAPPAAPSTEPAPKNGYEEPTGRRLADTPPAVPGLPRARPSRLRPGRAWRGWERLTRLFLAFTIALLLWLYVLNLENPAGATTFSRIPVTTHGLGNNLSLGLDLGTVTITAQAPQDVLSHLQAADLVAYVDLAGRGPGTYQLPVVVAPPPNVQGVVVEPSQLQVQITEVSERRLTVQLAPVGRPSLGYRIETQQVTPRDVLVRGPRDQVERIDQLVAEVDVEGKQGTQQGDVRPRALDFAGHEITGLVFNPPYVSVAVAIQQLLNYKTLPIHVPVEGAPAPGYRVTDITVQPTTLTASGLPTVLEPLNFLETAPVSIGGATQTVAVNITVPLAHGLTLYPPDASNRVQVRVAIEELSTKTQLSVLVHRIGLAPGLISVAAPERVDVTLSGPFAALQDLKPDSVQAVLDLTGYQVGTYKLTPVITSPARTTALAVDPAEVTLIITSPPTSLPEPTPALSPVTAPSPTPALPPPLATRFPGRPLAP